MNNLDTVKAIYQAFATGDVAFILGCLAESVEWDKWRDKFAQKAGVPYIQERNDIGGVAEFFGEVAKLGVKGARVTSLMEGGNKIAAEFEIEAERFGFEEEVHVWTFNDEGKVIGFRHYFDTAKHIEANDRVNMAT